MCAVHDGSGIFGIVVAALIVSLETHWTGSWEDPTIFLKLSLVKIDVLDARAWNFQFTMYLVYDACLHGTAGFY